MLILKFPGKLKRNYRKKGLLKSTNEGKTAMDMRIKSKARRTLFIHLEKRGFGQKRAKSQGKIKATVTSSMDESKANIFIPDRI